MCFNITRFLVSWCCEHELSFPLVWHIRNSFVSRGRKEEGAKPMQTSFPTWSTAIAFIFQLMLTTFKSCSLYCWHEYWQLCCKGGLSLVCYRHLAYTNCKVCMCYKRSADRTTLMMLCFPESLALGCWQVQTCWRQGHRRCVHWLQQPNYCRYSGR